MISKLELALEALGLGITFLDELEMTAAGAHVSTGYEIGRELLESLRNEANSAG